jgi:formylglycine-generating enzyme required for sulfatase activity
MQKSSLVTFLLLFLAAPVAGIRAESSQAPAPVHLVVKLIDGSYVKGAAGSEGVSLVTNYGKLDIPMKELAAIVFNDDRETVRLSLMNGDHLQGALKTDRFVLGTLLGDVSIASSKVAWVVAARGASGPAISTPELLAWLSEDLAIPEEPKDEHGKPVRTGTDRATGLPMEVRHRKTGIHLVLIPAGKFMMGSPDPEKDRLNSEILHLVRITKPFYMGKYEVTQAAWEAVMGANPSKSKDERNPVETVNWQESQEFIRRLNEARKEAKAKGEFSLPTEAQWEYACRAGSQTRCCFGDDQAKLGEYAWFEENSGDQTHPVGQKEPNAWGLYDMYGNVAEWCADWYGSYPTEEQVDPKGPEKGSMRVSRGFGLNVPTGWARSAMRGKNAAEDRHHGQGFRVILAAP